MKHENKIAIEILKRQYSDYPENDWHYDDQYKMIVEGIRLSDVVEQPKTEEGLNSLWINEDYFLVKVPKEDLIKLYKNEGAKMKMIKKLSLVDFIKE